MVVNRIKKNSKYLVFNAFEGNAFIGTIMGTICDDLYGSCAPFLVIENFIVSKENRRKGVGRKLIEELEDAAMQRDAYRAFLSLIRQEKMPGDFTNLTDIQKMCIKDTRRN